MKRDDVRCREVVEVLTEYFDGTLQVSDRTALEQHLLTCEGCANYVDQLRTTIVLTGRLREEDVPSPVVENVLQMFRERSGS